jgi:hypothetical protein
VLTKLNKYRRRKSVGSRRRSSRGRGRGGLSRLNINWRPILLFGGIGLAVVAVVLILVLVILPGGKDGQQGAQSTPSATNTPVATPIAREDMSEGEEELEGIGYKVIYDAYVSGDEIIFASGDKMSDSPTLDRLVIYNMTSATAAEVGGIEKKNSALFEPKLNANYIVYLDCKSENGGSVCAVDRATGEAFVLREYLFGMPKVSLSGNYAIWLQQVSKGTNSFGKDRLYVYDLVNKECVEIEVFVNTYFSTSAAYASGDAIVFVEPQGENLTTSQQGSSASTDAEICVIPLVEGGDTQAIRFTPGTFAYNPKISGGNIVYMDGTGGPGTNLMLCKKSGDTYGAPVKLATDVLNYEVGDGYVVYTLNGAVYIYYFSDGSTGRLSSPTTTVTLSSANGKDVIWYDISFGVAANALVHIQVP